MDDLIFDEVPVERLPSMVVAFAGWPDAADAATGAVRHLIDKLDAKKFAEIDAESFFDFTAVRPETHVNDEGERVIAWPASEFFYSPPGDESPGVVLFVGTEPNLRWKTFAGLMLEVARRCGVELVVSLGALLDAVPHTREAQITGRASTGDLAEKVKWLGITESGYQGPTGIHSALMQALLKEGLRHASLWGHSPHYVDTTPNSKVSHALLIRLQSLVDIDVDLDELRADGETFVGRVTRAIAGRSDVSAYVERLEQRYDAARTQSGEMPSSEDMVKELEQFLKSQEPGADPRNES